MQKVFSFLTVVGIALVLSPEVGVCEEYRIIKPTGESHPISMDLQGADIQSALKMIAEIENANIAFQRDVSGKIRSFQVSGVPASQVMDIVLKMNGLFAEKEGNVVIVYPIEDYTRYANARRELWGNR